MEENYDEFLTEINDGNDDKASQDKKPEVDPPKPIREPAPFPLGVLEGLEIRNPVVAIANLAQTNVEIAFHSVLAAINLVCSFNHSVIMNWRGGWRGQPISLFLATVAESGARKTTADNLALGGIKHAEGVLFDEYNKVLRPEYEAKLKSFSQRLQCGEVGLKKPEEPSIPTLTTSDPTMEGLIKIYMSGRQSIGLFSDDAAQFLCGRSGSEEKKLATMATLCKFYDGDSITIAQVTKAPTLIKSARLTMHLMVQPSDNLGEADIAGLYSKENKSQGILSRLLSVRAISLDGRRKLLDEPDPDTDKWQRCVQVYSNKCSRMTFSGLKSPNRAVSFDERSCKILREFYNHIESGLGAGGQYADMGRYLNKLVNNLARMAATFAIWEGNAIVTQLYTERALYMMEYYIENLKEMMSGNKYTKFSGYRDFLKSVKDKTFDMDYLKKRRPLKTDMELAMMIEDLIEYEWIHPMVTAGKNPSWAINPHLDDATKNWIESSFKLVKDKPKLK